MFEKFFRTGPSRMTACLLLWSPRRAYQKTL
jgi:hypothetical protein